MPTLYIMFSLIILTYSGTGLTIFVGQITNKQNAESKVEDF